VVFYGRVGEVTIAAIISQHLHNSCCCWWLNEWSIETINWKRTIDINLGRYMSSDAVKDLEFLTLRVGEYINIATLINFHIFCCEFF
jgi:hypothetical protein